MMTMQIKWVIVAALFMAGMTASWIYEHDKFVMYEAQVEQIGKDQAAASKIKDEQAKGNANDTQQSYIAAINSIDAYYRAHPVIRLRNTCSGDLPKTAGDTQGADAATTDGYASPYSPRDTEVIADRLYELQQLLRADGVTVE